MTRMSKMEAVGALCEIKSELENDLARHRERADRRVEEQVAPDADWSAYHEKQCGKLERQIRALEMAGTAMTR